MSGLGAFFIIYTGFAAASNEVVCDHLSLMQFGMTTNSVSNGQQDLVFMHVPMNFGNSVALTAAVGSGSTLSYGQVSGAASQGWGKINSMVKPNAPVWGPLDPDLQIKSGIGAPMYYTPQNLWPSKLAQEYFGDKKVFGILRDPFERIVAFFRSKGGVARGWEFTPDGRVCTDKLNKFVKDSLSPLLKDSSKSPADPNLHIQADYFEGKYGITLPVDLDKFPQSASTLLQEHGYNVTIQTNDMMHIIGCDDTWSGDLDEEAKSLIKQYYARDFDLRCKYFGYCDKSPNHCLVHVPGMCPAKLFKWDQGSSTYLKH